MCFCIGSIMLPFFAAIDFFTTILHHPEHSENQSTTQQGKRTSWGRVLCAAATCRRGFGSVVVPGACVG